MTGPLRGLPHLRRSEPAVHASAVVLIHHEVAPALRLHDYRRMPAAVQLPLDGCADAEATCCWRCCCGCCGWTNRLGLNRHRLRGRRRCAPGNNAARHQILQGRHTTVAILVEAPTREL